MDLKEDDSSHYELYLHRKNNTISSTSSLIPFPCSTPAADVEPCASSPSLNAMCAPGYPGALSLHHYRRYLSDSPPTDSDEIKKLRRKNAAFNLNQNPSHVSSAICHSQQPQPFSVSSVASSPPPLSPSYSPSAWSEQGPESLDGFRLIPGSPSPLDVNATEQVYSYAYPSPSRQQNAHRILDTFRDRLEKLPPTDTPSPADDHDEAEGEAYIIPSGSCKSPTTIIHHGTSFDIINPRASLRFARIVSYIEDVDSYRGKGPYSTDTSLRTQSIDEEDEEELHLNQETESPSPSHPRVEEETSKAYIDLVGDSPHHPMPSISERLEEETELDCEARPGALIAGTHRPVSMVSTDRDEEESDIGEPGSPICENSPEPGHGSSRGNAWDRPLPSSEHYMHNYNQCHSQNNHDYDFISHNHNQNYNLDHNIPYTHTHTHTPSPDYEYDYTFGYGDIPSMSALEIPSNPTEMHIHRQLSRRAIANRRKGQNGGSASGIGNNGAFRKFCALIRRKRSSSKVL